MTRQAIPARRVGLVAMDRAWAAIRARGVGAGFELRELAVEVGAEELNLKTMLRGLVAAGICDCSEPRRGHRTTYWLARDPGQARPRVRRDGTALAEPPRWQAIWRALWILKSGSVEELAAACGGAEVAVAPRDVRTALRWWERGGWVAIERGRGGRITRFRGARRPGPMAPVRHQLWTLWDPNAGEIAWQAAPGGTSDG